MVVSNGKNILNVSSLTAQNKKKKPVRGTKKNPPRKNNTWSSAEESNDIMVVSNGTNLECLITNREPKKKSPHGTKVAKEIKSGLQLRNQVISRLYQMVRTS
jgi:hypothetical protein